MALPLKQPMTALVSAAGTALVTLEPGAQIFEVQQVSIQGKDGGSNLASADIFFNDLFLCASANGQSDVASDAPYMILQQGDRLQVAWANMLPGSTCQALRLGVIRSAVGTQFR